MSVILVVEDEEPIQELIKEYLSPLNVEIYQALSGEEGVTLYRELLDKKEGRMWLSWISNSQG